MERKGASEGPGGGSRDEAEEQALKPLTAIGPDWSVRALPTCK
jgi:hypothetical protein